MQRVIKKFIANQPDGIQVIGLGSWTSGKNFDDVLAGGTSDFDMRMVPKLGTDDKTAMKQWKKARNQLRGYIIEEFGHTSGHADKVLAKTNLYAPNQLVKNVEDAEDAAKWFRKNGAVPTLSHSGEVNEATAKRLSEGLYGDPAKGWKQAYEAEKGRLWYRHNKNVYTTPPDLIHYGEGHGKFSAKNMGHTTRGWVEHAADELRKGDPRALVKQLKRVDRDLRKGREVARMGQDAAYRKELHSLIDDLSAPGAKSRLPRLTKRINKALSRGSMEAAILRRMDDAGPAQKVLLKTIMQSMELNSKLWKSICKVAKKVPAGAIVDGLFISAIYYSTADTAMNQSKIEALAKLIPDLAGITPGLMVEITDACLKEAKATGYVLAGNRQSAMDLIAGIYTARGREQAFDRQGKKYDVESIDQLVRQYRTRRKLDGFVMNRARHAAARDAGVETAKADAKTAQAIYDKCWPYLYQRWLAKRDEYRREYIRLLNKLRTTPLVLTYTPNPAILPKDGKPLDIVLTASYVGVDMGEVRTRMRQLLGILTAGGIYIDTKMVFSAKGTRNRNTLRVQAREAKKYATSVTVTDVCGAAQLGDAGIREQRIKRTASVEIVVKPGVAVGGVKGYCHGSYKGRYAKHKLLKGTMTRKGWIRFRITGTKVKGWHVGENGESDLIGTYNPTTKRFTARATTKLVSTAAYSLSGTYNESTQTFTGAYTAVYTPWKGKHRFTESGSWTAKGKLTTLAPPKKKDPKKKPSPRS
jgi:hypothetical protein